ncbi:MAG: hypothetical protein ACRCY8_08065, partial [Dermatophilaceae bacterium]
RPLPTDPITGLQKLGDTYLDPLTGQELAADESGRVYDSLSGLHIDRETGDLSLADPRHPGKLAELEELANGHLKLGELEVDPGTGLWFDQDGSLVDPFGKALEIDKETGYPVDHLTGALVDPHDGQLLGPDGKPLEFTGDGLLRMSDDRLVDPNTGLGYDAKTGALVDAKGTPLPVDEASGLPRDPVTRALVDPQTGQFVGADGEPLAYTDDGRLVAGDGTVVDPDTGERRDAATNAVVERRGDPGQSTGEHARGGDAGHAGDGKQGDGGPGDAAHRAGAHGDGRPGDTAGTHGETGQDGQRQRVDADDLQVTTRTDDGELTEVEISSGDDDVTIRLADELTDGTGVDAHLQVEVGRDRDGDTEVTVTVDLDDPATRDDDRAGTSDGLTAAAAGRRERQGVGA